MSKVLRFSFTLGLLLSSARILPAQELAPLPYVNPEWVKPYEPFRIAGNLYYVGTYDLASYFITTPEGHILINTGLAESAATIRKSVESLGFKFSDIKILLATHAHYDHVAAMAEIRRATGAKMMIHEADAQVLADGGKSDFIFGGAHSFFTGVPADRLLKDGDVLHLGDTEIKVLHHPGHTKGATSFLVDTKDDKRSWKVLVVNMPTILSETRIYGMPAYPSVGKDYGYTLASLKKLQFDLWVSSHASQFGLHENRKEGDPYRPEAFGNRDAYDAVVKDLQQAYDDRLKSEKK